VSNSQWGPRPEDRPGQQWGQRPGQQWQGQTQPGWGPQPPAAPKGGLFKKGCGLVASFAGAFIVVAVVFALVKGGSTTTVSTQPPVGTPASSSAASSPSAKAAAPASKAAGDTVTYVVTGSPADVMYGPSGSSFSHKVPLNVSKPLGSPQYYSISAQLQGSGQVSCELKVNGKVMSKASASGGYNIATCEIVQDPINGGWIDANHG
jgi:hypothetical protein